jgi:hypothetical protein
MYHTIPVSNNILTHTVLNVSTASFSVHKSNGEREEFEDTTGVSRIRKSKKNIQNNDQKKKDIQRPTKHYTEKINYMNPIKNGDSHERSWKCYDKCNIFVVICATDIP